MSDGSVMFRAVAKDRGTGTNKERGQWKQDGNQNIWYHDHQVNQPAKKLRVNVIYGTGTGCTDPTTDIDGRYFHLTYTRSDNVTAVQFKVFIQVASDDGVKPGRLAVESAATPDATAPFWLKVGEDGDRLTKVKFESGLECTLTQKSQLHIYQKIKP